MNHGAKKFWTWVVIAFVLFFVLGQPREAADIAQSGVGLLRDAGEAGIEFMRSLAN